jgi:hypothetical protein
MRHQKVYVEELGEIIGKKGKIRREISNKVSDRDDLIADLFKLVFINLSLVKELYELVDYSELSDEKKEMFEYGFKRYEETETILDYYMQKGDLSFIDRILERQNKIVDKIKDK